MKTKIVIAIACLVLIVGVVWSSRGQSDTFRVGALLCLTGPCAEWGENSLNGIRLAAEEINAGGGILGKQIEIVVEDSAEGDPINAVKAYQNLRAKDVSYIIGPSWTNAALAVAPIAAKDSVLITSPSVGVKDFNEAGENIFNIWPHDEIATRELAHFAYDHGSRRVAIVSSKDSWYQLQGNVFEEEFQKLGGTIVIKDELSLDQTDLKTNAAKINALKPDTVMYANFDNQGIIAKDLRQMGFVGKQYAILMDESRIDQSQGALENSIFVQYAKPTPEFVAKYKSKFNREPGITTDTAYDIMKIYAQIVGEANTSSLASVNSVFSSLKTYSGASGELTFDDKGRVTKPPVFYIVKGSEFVEYSK